jgi:hypothetical protein
MSNGYCQIVVNGETIGLRFGMLANRMMAERFLTDSTIMNNGQLNEVGIAYLIYAGYCNWCAVKDEQPKYKVGYFIEYVEECEVDETKLQEFQNIGDVYSKSKFTGKYLEEINKVTEEIKKKITEKSQESGMKSNHSVTENSGLDQQNITG